MSDEVEQFLKKLGFDSTVVQRFLDHKIRYSLLPLLTKEHLGVLLPSIGDQLVFTQGVKELAKNVETATSDDVLNVNSSNGGIATFVDKNYAQGSGQYSNHNKVDTIKSTVQKHNPSEKPLERYFVNNGVNVTGASTNINNGSNSKKAQKTKRKKSDLTLAKRREIIKTIFASDNVKTAKVISKAKKDLKGLTPELFWNCKHIAKKLINYEHGCLNCPYCFKTLTPTIIFSGKKKEVRLQLSNFRRHLKNAHKGKKKRNEKKRQSSSEESNSSSSSSDSSNSDSSSSDSSSSSFSGSSLSHNLVTKTKYKVLQPKGKSVKSVVEPAYELPVVDKPKVATSIDTLLAVQSSSEQYQTNENVCSRKLDSQSKGHFTNIASMPNEKSESLLQTGSIMVESDSQGERQPKGTADAQLIQKGSVDDESRGIKPGREPTSVELVDKLLNAKPVEMPASKSDDDGQQDRTHVATALHSKEIEKSPAFYSASSSSNSSISSSDQSEDESKFAVAKSGPSGIGNADIGIRNTKKNPAIVVTSHANQRPKRQRKETKKGSIYKGSTSMKVAVQKKPKSTKRKMPGAKSSRKKQKSDTDIEDWQDRGKTEFAWVKFNEADANFRPAFVYKKRAGSIRNVDAKGGVSLRNLMKHPVDFLLKTFNGHEGKLKEIYEEQIKQQKRSYKEKDLPHMIALDILTDEQFAKMATFAESKLSVIEIQHNSSDVIFDCIVPHWALLVFCQEFHLTRMEAIETLKAQSKALIEMEMSDF